MHLETKGRIFKSVILLLVFSVLLNAFLFLKIAEKEGPGAATRQMRLVNPINPSIDSNNQEADVVLHYKGLRQKIEEDINATTKLDNVGVFVQDVRTGAWLGINEREDFVPASLLKIPIMMSILKKVDRGEMKLTDVVEIELVDIDPFSGELYAKGAGARLTVWALLKEMILSSDNTAKNALKRQLTIAELNSVFVHVGIDNPYISENTAVTPRGYTRLFKALYFSTYLSPEMSEKALDITTDTREEDLISEGIPPEVQVAHKYGVTIGSLHDCGIVYHPASPYFICVMTRNVENTEEAKNLITRISSDVFDFVNGQ